ncbi:MAG: amidohydrolase family protein [Nitrospinota bacterium]
MIDGHVHLITRSIIEDAYREIGMDPPSRSEGSPFFEEDADITQFKKEWLRIMDQHDLEKAVFMGLSAGNKEFTEFISSSDRFFGLTSVDPTQPDAVITVKKEIAAGMKGVKLYPPLKRFSVADKRAYEVYEYCNTSRIPIVIHFGITIGPKCDLRFGNPLDLSPVISDFPKLPFIIAHFGAGFFREALMLTYKKDNVYFDTSGTNNWLCYHPHSLSLTDVFKQTVSIVGADHVIFGTDTRLRPDPYRLELLTQQKSILNLLLTRQDVELVMGKNADRIFKLG